MKKALFTLLFVSLFVATGICQESITFSKKEGKKIEKLIGAFTGAYSNQEQADTAHHKMLGAQKARIFRIWQDKYPNDYWVYSGWFYAGDDENPFRETIYHCVKLSNDTLYLQAFTCVPEFRKEGLVKAEWKEEKPFANLPFERLAANEFNCGYIAFPYEEGYMLHTIPHVCPSNVANSPFEKIGFELQVYKAGITIRNEYFMKNRSVVKLPQGVIFKLITRSRKSF